MKQIKKDSGFTLVEALIIVLIVAVVAFAGWWVWQKNQEKEDENKKTNTSQSTQSDQQTTASYLNIKEWSVRVMLSEKIADAYYVHSGQSTEKSDIMYLSTEEFKGTGCAADQGSLGSFIRFTADFQEPGADMKETERRPNAIKIGDYYYDYTSPQAACSDDAATQQKEIEAVAAFKEAAKTFEAIP